MLKFKIDSLDGLDESVSALYSKSGDGYQLKIEGLPKTEDVDGLKSKVAELLDEAKKAKKAAKDAATAKDEAERQRAQKDGDVDAINASWQAKYDKAIGELTEERDGAFGMLKQEKVHSQARKLASQLAVPGSADVLLPHIESRLSMEIKDGRAVAVVKDLDGKPSALNLEELGKEIASNAAFAPLIVASNASGSGANGQNSGRAAPKTMPRSEFAGMSPQAKTKFMHDGGQLTE